MSYCPKCRFEYETGVLTCPDCNESLVDHLPPEEPAAMTPDDSWVLVGLVSSEMKSDVAKGALDSNNIPSVIISSSFSAYGRGTDFGQGLGQVMAGGNVILVPREFRDDAELVLRAVLGDDLIQPNV